MEPSAVVEQVAHKVGASQLGTVLIHLKNGGVVRASDARVGTSDDEIVVLLYRVITAYLNSESIGGVA